MEPDPGLEPVVDPGPEPMDGAAEEAVGSAALAGHLNQFVRL